MALHDDVDDANDANDETSSEHDFDRLFAPRAATPSSSDSANDPSDATASTVGTESVTDDDLGDDDFDDNFGGSTFDLDAALGDDAFAPMPSRVGPPPATAPPAPSSSDDFVHPLPPPPVPAAGAAPIDLNIEFQESEPRLGSDEAVPPWLMAPAPDPNQAVSQLDAPDAVSDAHDGAEPEQQDFATERSGPNGVDAVGAPPKEPTPTGPQAEAAASQDPYQIPSDYIDPDYFASRVRRRSAPGSSLPSDAESLPEETRSAPTLDETDTGPAVDDAVGESTFGDSPIAHDVRPDRDSEPAVEAAAEADDFESLLGFEPVQSDVGAPESNMPESGSAESATPEFSATEPGIDEALHTSESMQHGIGDASPQESSDESAANVWKLGPLEPNPVGGQVAGPPAPATIPPVAQPGSNDSLNGALNDEVNDAAPAEAPAEAEAEVDAKPVAAAGPVADIATAAALANAPAPAPETAAEPAAPAPPTAMTEQTAPPEADAGYDAEIPPRPVRRSMADDELLTWVDNPENQSTGTLSVIEVLEAQLRLREQEANEYREWETTLRAKAGPVADEVIEEVRPQFSDVIASERVRQSDLSEEETERTEATAAVSPHSVAAPEPDPAPEPETAALPAWDVPPPSENWAPGEDFDSEIPFAAHADPTGSIALPGAAEGLRSDVEDPDDVAVPEAQAAPAAPSAPVAPAAPAEPAVSTEPANPSEVAEPAAEHTAPDFDPQAGFLSLDEVVTQPSPEFPADEDGDYDEQPLMPPPLVEPEAAPTTPRSNLDEFVSFGDFGFTPPVSAADAARGADPLADSDSAIDDNSQSGDSADSPEQPFAFGLSVSGANSGADSEQASDTSTSAAVAPSSDDADAVADIDELSAAAEPESATPGVFSFASSEIPRHVSRRP